MSFYGVPIFARKSGVWCLGHSHLYLVPPESNLSLSVCQSVSLILPHILYKMTTILFKVWGALIDVFCQLFKLTGLLIVFRSFSKEFSWKTRLIFKSNCRCQTANQNKSSRIFSRQISDLMYLNSQSFNLFLKIWFPVLRSGSWGRVEFIFFSTLIWYTVID